MHQRNSLIGFLSARERLGGEHGVPGGDGDSPKHSSPRLLVRQLRQWGIDGARQQARAGGRGRRNSCCGSTPQAGCGRYDSARPVGHWARA